MDVPLAERREGREHERDLVRARDAERGIRRTRAALHAQVVGSQGGEGILVGDVVICPRVAERQALEHNVAIDDELSLLVVHGVLHLLGFDHERLTYRYAGRDFRLTDVHGKVIKSVVA